MGRKIFWGIKWFLIGIFYTTHMLMCIKIGSKEYWPAVATLREHNESRALVPSAHFNPCFIVSTWCANPWGANPRSNALSIINSCGSSGSPFHWIMYHIGSYKYPKAFWSWTSVPFVRHPAKPLMQMYWISIFILIITIEYWCVGHSLISLNFFTSNFIDLL